MQLHPDAFSGEQKRPTQSWVGPFLAALVVLAVTEGKSGVMGLLAQRPWSSIATAAVERG